MGSGTWEVKAGVCPAGPGPPTVPAASQPLLSRRAGFWGVITACFPRPQAGERAGEAALCCCPSTRAQVMRPSSVKFFSQPHSAWVWRRPPPPPPPPTSTGEAAKTPDSKDWRRRGGWRLKPGPRVPLAWQAASWRVRGPSGRCTHRSPPRAPRPSAARATSYGDGPARIPPGPLGGRV